MIFIDGSKGEGTFSSGTARAQADFVTEPSGLPSTPRIWLQRAPRKRCTPTPVHGRRKGDKRDTRVRPRPQQPCRQPGGSPPTTSEPEGSPAAACSLTARVCFILQLFVPKWEEHCLAPDMFLDYVGCLGKPAQPGYLHLWLAIVGGWGVQKEVLKRTSSPESTRVSVSHVARWAGCGRHITLCLRKLKFSILTKKGRENS